MYTHSNRKLTGLPMKINKVNQAAVMPENSADDLPKQLHAWCMKMKLMPPKDLPSIDELAKLCRGKACPALSYIIRYYQPRNRVIAFRQAQAAKANKAEETALLAEKSRLEAILREKDKEVEQWNIEVARLEKHLKDTERQKREWDLKTEEYEAQTRLLTAKAGEIDMRLRSNKQMSEYLKSLAPTQLAKGAPELSDKQKVELIALLKAAANDEKALKEAVDGFNCAELHNSLVHSQKQLLHKAESLITAMQNSSENVSPSALEGELSRLQHEIAATILSTRITKEKNNHLQDKQQKLEQVCVDAIMADSSNRLVDIMPASEDAQRIVETVVQRANSDFMHAKLAALEAEEAASERTQAEPFAEGMLKAQREMRTLTASVQESLTVLAASEACAEKYHAQALAALADSPLPGDAALARARVDGLAESITAMEVSGESAVEPTLQERVIEAHKQTAKFFETQKYLSALESVDLPSVEMLDENIAANACAAETAITSALDKQLTKLGEDIAASLMETSAATEAAAQREHPVRLLVPQEMTVAGKSYHEWEELCKAAVDRQEGTSSMSFLQ